MKQEFKVTGAKRKALVEAISNYTQQKAEYQYTPTYAYKIGEYTVDKHGCLIAKSITDEMIDYLKQAGFDPEAPRVELNLTFDLSQFSEASLKNLKQIIWAKGILIRHALGLNDLPIEEDNQKISFNWFSKIKPENAHAYQQFINHLIAYAKSRKRVNSQPREYENERYSFRCFLLRLGFIGKEYKETRHILLQNLTGNAAFLHTKEVN